MIFDFKKIEFLKEVLKEDIGRGDLARELIDGGIGRAFVVAKEGGILSGVKYIEDLEMIADLQFDFLKSDGCKIEKGDIICEIEGDSRDILSCERTILNILQHSSGIATNANRFVKKAKNRIKVLDTRKTRPLLREFEKYSAKVGGVTNHRLGLDDCLMLKDTHLALFNSITEAVKIAREKIPFTTKIEVECETFEQAKEAINCGVEIVMCDNMDRDTIKKVVEYRNKNSKFTLIEASGNITLNTIEDYVELGVDAVSSGSIIHQATFLDFSMKIKES